MATYTLEPNITISADSGAWVPTSGTIHGVLAGVGSISTSTTGIDFRVGFENLALAGNETIDSIQACIT